MWHSAVPALMARSERGKRPAAKPKNHGTPKRSRVEGATSAVVPAAPAAAHYAVAPATAGAAMNPPAAAEELVAASSQLPSRKRSDDAAARSRSPLPVPIAAFPAPPRRLWRAGVLQDFSGKR